MFLARLKRRYRNSFCTHPSVTYLCDLEVKVTDFEILFKILVNVFTTLYFSNIGIDLVDSLPGVLVYLILYHPDSTE